jgi:CubicO group peptidase (beta-lactamase class C family)
MTSSGTTVEFATSGMLASPYGDNNGQSQVRSVEYKNPAVSFSAGMLASTVDDLIKYSQALLSRQLLSPAAYQTYWYQRPLLPNGNPSPWAFGWSSKDEPKYGTRMISMNGGTPGVASTIILFPEKNSAVISLCNLRKPAVPAIARKVASLVFAVAPPASAQPLPAEEPSGE